MEYSEAEKIMEDAILSGAALDFDSVVPFRVADALLSGAQIYRAMYESAEKKVMRYRDVAGQPDIHIPERNKDAYSNLSDAERGYDAYIEYSMEHRLPTLPFGEWLFSKRNDRKEDI